MIFGSGSAEIVLSLIVVVMSCEGIQSLFSERAECIAVVIPAPVTTLEATITAYVGLDISRGPTVD